MAIDHVDLLRSFQQHFRRSEPRNETDVTPPRRQPFVEPDDDASSACQALDGWSLGVGMWSTGKQQSSGPCWGDNSIFVTPQAQPQPDTPSHGISHPPSSPDDDDAPFGLTPQGVGARAGFHGTQVRLAHYDSQGTPSLASSAASTVSPPPPVVAATNLQALDSSILSVSIHNGGLPSTPPTTHKEFADHGIAKIHSNSASAPPPPTGPPALLQQFFTPQSMPPPFSTHATNNHHNNTNATVPHRGGGNPNGGSSSSTAGMRRGDALLVRNSHGVFLLQPQQSAAQSSNASNLSGATGGTPGGPPSYAAAITSPPPPPYGACSPSFSPMMPALPPPYAAIAYASTPRLSPASTAAQHPDDTSPGSIANESIASAASTAQTPTASRQQRRVPPPPFMAAPPPTLPRVVYLASAPPAQGALPPAAPPSYAQLLAAAAARR